MKTLASVSTRRDRCYLFARRAMRLKPLEAAGAWYLLAEKVESMGEMDVPKFNDLLIAISLATKLAKRQPLNEKVSNAGTKTV